MKQHLDDINHECLVCKVPNECRPGHHLCGISKGIKYEHYREDAHRDVNGLIPKDLRVQLKYGVAWKRKEIPLFGARDGMVKFCEKVAKYSERGMMKITDWELGK